MDKIYHIEGLTFFFRTVKFIYKYAAVNRETAEVNKNYFN